MLNKKPVPVPRRELESTQFIRRDSAKHALPVLMFEVRPKGKYHVSLGDFTSSNPPIGFSLEITPEDVRDEVAVQITKLSATYSEYELVLHISNESELIVNVEVRQL